MSAKEVVQEGGEEAQTNPFPNETQHGFDSRVALPLAAEHVDAQGQDLFVLMFQQRRPASRGVCCENAQAVK